MKKTFFTLSMVLVLSQATIIAQDLQWVQAFGEIVPTDMDVEFDDTYVTGYFTGTVDFDPGVQVDSRTSKGNADIFLACFNMMGELSWVRTMGGPGNDEAFAVSCSTYVSVTGSFEETAHFDTTFNGEFTSLGGKDMFYATYNTWDGSFLGAMVFGGPGSSVGTAIYEEMGNIYVGGKFDGAVTLENDTVHSTNSSFLLAYIDIDGVAWYMYDLETNTGTSEITDIYKSGGGSNVYFTGNFSGDIDIVPNETWDNATSNGQTDVFFSGYSYGDGFSFIKAFGGTGAESSVGIFEENGMNVYLAGSFSGETVLDPEGISGKYNSSGNSDVFLAKYDFNGFFTWAKKYGGAGDDLATGFSATFDDLYLGGKSNGSLNISIAGEDYFVPNKGAFDSWFIKLDRDGNNQMVFPVGGTGAVEVAGFDVGFNDNMSVAGVFSATVDFDPGLETTEKTASGEADMFVASYSKYYMYLTTPEEQCPLMPYYFVPEREKTPGLELTWQYNDGMGWKNISDGYHFKVYGADSLMVLPEASFDGYQYRYIAKDDFGIDTLDFEAYLYLWPLTPVSIGGDVTLIPGQGTTFDPGPGYYGYSWNTGATTQSITTDSAGFYIVTITDANGCENRDTAAVNVSALVTVDSLTNRIMIVWGKSVNPLQQSLNLYRSVNQNRQLINSTSFSTENRFWDEGANPDLGPITYTFELKNDLSGDSTIIAKHVTMHLEALSYPNDNKTVISWNAYEGLNYDTFYVYRGPSADQLEMIGKVKYKQDLGRYSFTDHNYFPDTMYYRVQIKVPVSILVLPDKKANNGPFSRSLSNLEDNRQQAVGVHEVPYTRESDENPLKVFPNPVHGHATLKFPNPGQAVYTLRVLDISGKVFFMDDQVTGQEYVFDTGDIPAGLYIMELRGDKVYRAKVVRN